MARTTKFLLLLLFAIPGYQPASPAPNKPPAGFTLKLSMDPHSGEFPETMHEFIVRYTNTSNQKDYEKMCAGANWGALYHLAVTYNSTPVKTSPEARKRIVNAQAGICGNRIGGPFRNLEPGQSREHTLYFDAPKPGTYTFTVDVDTDPLHPAQNINVKSNTITITVPTPPIVRTPKPKKYVEQKFVVSHPERDAAMKKLIRNLLILAAAMCALLAFSRQP